MNGIRGTNFIKNTKKKRKQRVTTLRVMNSFYDLFGLIVIVKFMSGQLIVFGSGSC